MRFGMMTLLAAALLVTTGCGPREVKLAPANRDIAFASSLCDKDDPFAAGKTAAEDVKAQLGDSPVKAVLISESYEDQARKAKVLAGVCSVFDKAVVYGGASYGVFGQAGAFAGESVAVLAIAGKDIQVASAVQKNLGASKLTPAEHKAQIKAKLVPAGAALAKQLPKTPASRLMIVVADAHSPKNSHLVAGILTVTGGGFPILGGCANKNAGQTFITYKGEMLTDAAMGLMLSGDFQVALVGRTAKDNDAVISTAKQAAAAALNDLNAAGAHPAAFIAFDCAGRKGKLDDVNDELTAIQEAVGGSVPIFGSYNAGEIGPADVTDKKAGVLSSGMGWHLMIGAIGWGE